MGGERKASKFNVQGVKTRSPNTFGSLMAIEEEEGGGGGNLKNEEDSTLYWNSRNLNYLKKLNELDAKVKR